jgi:hypothetical protein
LRPHACPRHEIDHPFAYDLAIPLRHRDVRTGEIEQLDIQPFTFRDITPPLVVGGAS